MKSLPSSIFAILIVLFWVTSCGNNSLTHKGLKSLEQDEQIKVYFNQNRAKNAQYTDPYRNIKRPGDNLEKILIEAINSAEKSIDVAVQELRLPKIAQALVNQHNQGIKVRIILENQYNKSWQELTQNNYEQINERTQTRYQELAALLDINQDGKISNTEINQRDAIVILRNRQIPLIDDTEDGSKGSGLMHHKFIIIDNKKVLTGSANFTLSDIHGDLLKPETRGNANNLVTINSPEIAQIFTEEFNLMWGDGPGNQSDSLFGSKKNLREPITINLNNSKITIQFSPFRRDTPWNLTSNGLIDKTLNKADQSVNLALFVFTDQPIVNTLEKRRNLGAEIKALIDPSFAYRYYSEGLDMLGVALSNKCKYEKDNNPWQNPIQTVGIPNLPQGDLLHHKFAVIDEEIVITGSHNWSDAANYTNDETVLIIENPMIAAHYQREFNNLYSNAILGLPVSIQRRIEEDKVNCQNVNITNNNLKIINLNTATKSELESLPGIGSALAERIIKARQEKPFVSLEDLAERVSGIGQNSIQNLRGKVKW
jgi:phosphatidylserine/phosphatidylglycerophosphate/cardiolipin synthase-like enzyme